MKSEATENQYKTRVKRRNIRKAFITKNIRQNKRETEEGANYILKLNDLKYKEETS